jgi:putative peptidoglycan lipid II flippase
MAVTAANCRRCPALRGDELEVAASDAERLNDGMHRIAFWIVPSAMAFLAIGDVVAGVIYQNGEFDRAVAVWVWGILAGSAVGLLATTLRPLVCESALYALRDTKTPIRFALVRVALTLVLGYLFALPLRAALGRIADVGCCRSHHLGRDRGMDRVRMLRRAVNRASVAHGHRRVATRNALWLCAAARGRDRAGVRACCSVQLDRC